MDKKSFFPVVPVQLVSSIFRLLDESDKVSKGPHRFKQSSQPSLKQTEKIERDDNNHHITVRPRIF